MTGNADKLPPPAPEGGPVRFPETAEEEARRVGEYFAQHPPATEAAQPSERHRDTYGDEDSSLPDRPMGDK